MTLLFRISSVDSTLYVSHRLVAWTPQPHYFSSHLPNFGSTQCSIVFSALSPLSLILSRSLTSLTLHSDLDVGVVPRVDFSQLDFPALASLSLQMILFNEETHVEDFIVRHKHTLKSLHLVGCHITFFGLAKGPPQVWSQIWARFADELEALVQLLVQPDHNGNQVWPNVSYVHLDEQIGYSYLRVWRSDGESVIKANDDRAERMFHEVVRSRRCKLTRTAKKTWCNEPPSPYNVPVTAPSPPLFINRLHSVVHRVFHQDTCSLVD